MKDNWIPVEGSENLVRDRNSGAILNINTNEIETARIRKANKLKEKQELQQLKKDVEEIKTILFKLAEKLDG